MLLRSMPRNETLSRRAIQRDRGPRSPIARREAAWCSLIDAESIQKTYKTFTDKIAKDLGGDWDKIYTNPPEYPELNAMACVVGPATITFDGQPECSSGPTESPHVASIQGGVVDLAFDSGTSTQAHITVNEQAAFPLAGSVEADMHWQFDEPQGAGGPDLALRATIINADQESAQASHGNLTTNRVKATAAPNQSCFQPLTNVTCTATGKGRIQIAYSGNLWFNYPTPRGTQPNVHYKWAPGLDASLDDRSTYISFTATVSSYTLTQDSQGPQCRFAEATGPALGPTASAKPNVDKYLAPTLVVIALICGAGVYWFWRRRRRQRVGRLDSAPPATSPVDAPYPSISEYTAAPTPGGSGQQRRLSAATSAWDASLPAYSEVGRDS